MDHVCCAWRAAEIRTMKRSCLTLLGILVLVAQTHGAERDSAQPIVLKASHLFDARSGRLTNGGVVVIQGERIVSVGNAAPANARVIDLGDATLLPGFIDAHVHLDGEL